MIFTIIFGILAISITAALFPEFLARVIIALIVLLVIKSKPNWVLQIIMTYIIVVQAINKNFLLLGIFLLVFIIKLIPLTKNIRARRRKLTKEEEEFKKFLVFGDIPGTSVKEDLAHTISRQKTILKNKRKHKKFEKKNRDKLVIVEDLTPDEIGQYDGNIPIEPDYNPTIQTQQPRFNPEDFYEDYTVEEENYNQPQIQDNYYENNRPGIDWDSGDLLDEYNKRMGH